MAFALDRPDELLAHAVKRLAGRLLAQAAADLAQDAAGRSVFGARKSIKKTRSLLRLVRSCAPGFHHANAELREIGRRISARREGEVLPLTAAKRASDAPAEVAIVLSELAASSYVIY